MPRRTIDLDDDLDRWRYRCPLNHSDWALRTDEIYCRSCRNSVGLSREQARYSALVDARTGERIPLDQVEVIVEGRTERVSGEVSRA
jgi:hypothetical protein